MLIAVCRGSQRLPMGSEHSPMGWESAHVLIKDDGFCIQRVTDASFCGSQGTKGETAHVVRSEGSVVSGCAAEPACFAAPCPSKGRRPTCRPGAPARSPSSLSIGACVSSRHVARLVFCTSLVPMARVLSRRAASEGAPGQEGEVGVAGRDAADAGGEGEGDRVRVQQERVRGALYQRRHVRPVALYRSHHQLSMATDGCVPRRM